MLSTDSITREPGLLGQTVVVIGGSAGIGLETARHARAAGAAVLLTARNAERKRHALAVARSIVGRVRPGGTLLLIGGTGST